jgi:hypothetical protein
MLVVIAEEPNHKAAIFLAILFSIVGSFLLFIGLAQTIIRYFIQV